MHSRDMNSQVGVHLRFTCLLHLHEHYKKSMEWRL